MKASNKLIEFKNVHLAFDGKRVIQNLSLRINKGDKVVISGKSGSGKSSLLSLVLGFIQPDRGDVLFDGVPVDEKTVWAVRKKVAYIDQDVSLGTGTVQGLFDYVSNLKINTHSGMTLIELMKFFHLDINLFLKEIRQLSGGERQRMAIVTAILLKRNVYFLDEVTASLDKHLKKKVADYFISREDSTCIIVSHDPVWLDNSVVRVFDFEEKKWRH
ncbi:MAG: ATP-binding cassette domain-containing protein [Candidatus Sabulitectum sp.]|nr:ATP-binding cassette domain-containing protein [Candidatus Sabulitectum sp.]